MKLVQKAWAQLLTWWTVAVLYVRARVFLVHHGVQETFDEGADALRKIADARLCAPDTVSAGEAHGGPAIFFRHDGGTEVFIGRTFSHAADEFLQWIRVQNEADQAPSTKHTSKLNRAQRRFWASNKRPKLAD